MLQYERLDVFEAKIEESGKASSHRESNPGHLAYAASALPLSYDHRTTAGLHPAEHLDGENFPVDP